jgi:hypothetical protein
MNQEIQFLLYNSNMAGTGCCHERVQPAINARDAGMRNIITAKTIDY